MSRSIIRKLAALGLAAGLTAGIGREFRGRRQAASGRSAPRPAFEQVDSIPMLTRPA